MSTDTGIGRVVSSAVREAATQLRAAAAEERQLDLLDPLTAEELIDARAEMGAEAGHLAVVRHARERRKAGRPPGSLNRRTDDLVAYLSEFGPDPAVAAMRIIGTDEELMIQRSIDAKDPYNQRMTFAQAQSHRMRMIEAMLPYFHGKKPVQVDLGIRRLPDLVFEGMDALDQAVGQSISDADFVDVESLRDSVADGDAGAIDGAGSEK